MAKTRLTEPHAPVIDVGPELAFADVPNAALDSMLDPHWAQLRTGTTLPSVYLPPAMAGERPIWLRTIAVGLVAMFVAATAAGVCLTYGPPQLRP